MGQEIAGAYDSDDAGALTLVSILSGAMIFTADLIRHLPLKMKIGLITISAYRGATTESRGAKILQDLDIDVSGQHVLVVDDILDTGGTLRLVKNRLMLARPRSVQLCVLLRKPSKVPPDIQADFVGFDIPDEFVVGYGLDYNDHYRNFPDIGVLREDLYRVSPDKTGSENIL
jgi:hypoxanthine phosphoribosyltransferase